MVTVEDVFQSATEGTNPPGRSHNFLHKAKIQAPDTKEIEQYDQLFDFYDRSNTGLVSMGRFV